MVTIAIVITILWAKCYFGRSGCSEPGRPEPGRPELVGNEKCDRNLMNQIICNQGIGITEK